MAYTQVSSVSSVTAAYERLAYFALRPELHFDGCADVRPTRQTHPGSSVQWTLYDELAAATTALTETNDVTAVAMSDSTVSVTLVEYGNAVQTTAKVRGTSFLGIDSDAANVIGFNAGLTIDTLARNVLQAGDNVLYSAVEDATAGRTNVDDGDVISADLIRQAVANLRAANAKPYIVGRGEGMFRGHIHPDVSYDLRRETGAANWRSPHSYQDTNEIYVGSVGSFEGVEFIETPRAPLFANASDGAGSTGNVDVYGTLITGREALAKVYSQLEYGPLPSIVIGPVTDNLRRFHTVGWKWLGGYGRFREACLRRIESSSSIGANT